MWRRLVFRGRINCIWEYFNEMPISSRNHIRTHQIDHWSLSLDVEKFRLKLKTRGKGHWTWLLSRELRSCKSIDFQTHTACSPITTLLCSYTKQRFFLLILKQSPLFFIFSCSWPVSAADTWTRRISTYYNLNQITCGEAWVVRKAQDNK
jgi:hypothetical protein